MPKTSAITEAVGENQAFINIPEAHTDDALIWTDKSKKIVGCNKATEELLGYAENELVKKEAKRIFPEGFPKTNKSQLKVKTKDGQLFAASVSLSAMRDGSGKSTGFVVRISKGSEQELGDELFEIMVNSAPAIIFVIQDGKFKFVNQQLQHDTGFSKEELLSLDPLSLVHPDDREAVQIWDQSKTTSPVHEFRTTTKNGELKWLQGKTVPIIYDGEAAILGNYTDITDRKQAGEALRESQEKFAVAFRSNPGSVTISSLEDGRYVEVNDSFTRLTGYERSEAIGHTSLELNIWAKAEQRERLMEEFRLHESVHDLECLFRHKSGKLLTGLISGEIITLGNKPYLLVTAVDITERKEAEKALRQQEKRFRQMIELFPFPIWIRTADKTTEYINPQFTNDFGYTIADIPATQAWIEPAPVSAQNKDQPISGPEIDQLLSSDNDTEIKQAFNVTCKDGNIKHVTIRSLRMDDGRTYMIFHDITESMLMGKALRESEARFRTIFENANDEIIYLDKFGTIIDRNVKGENSLGYTLEEVIGKNIAELDYMMPQKQLSAMEYLFTDAIKGSGGRGMVELELTHKNGEPVQLEASISTLKKDGKIEGILIITRDITERISAEETIRKQAHDLGKRLKELHCLYGISKYADKPGISLEDLIQATVRLIPYAWQYPEITCAQIILDNQVFTTEDFQETAWKQTSNITIQGKRVGVIEVCYLAEKPDGDEGPFLREEKELLDALAEQLRRFIEQRQAESALRESEAKYSALVEQSSSSVIIIQNGAVRFANKAYADLIGCSQEEALSISLFDLLNPDDSKNTAQRKNLHRKYEETALKPEAKIRCKDGTIKHLEITKGTIMFRGKPATMATLRDVTERKQAEEEQRRLLASLEEQNQIIAASHKELQETLDRLEQAHEELKKSQEYLLQTEKLAAIGELASGVAHEVNNPLMAISGHAQLLLEDAEDEDIKESLEIIHNETKRATSIVQNLLSFARKQNSEKNWISINDAIENTVKLRSYGLSKNNIEIITEMDHDLPEVMADSQKLQQVFLNLINNAAQAMSEAHNSGTLLIQTMKINDKTIQITFTDDGPGIPQEIIDRVFEPFFTTKDVGKGTGLGLSICYGIIHSHGGKIYAESTKGRGATFTIELPIHNKDKKQGSRARN